MKNAPRFLMGMIAGALMLTPIASVGAGGIAPGTTLTGAIDRELNSKDTQVGTPFLLRNVNSHAYDINGATVYGHVSYVQSGGAGRKAEIKLAIDKINTRSGNIYKVSANVTNVQVNTKSNAGREAGAGAAGALVGGLIAGGWGAIIGGGGGYLIGKNQHQNISVPAGSLVSVDIQSARRQSQ